MLPGMGEMSEYLIVDDHPLFCDALAQAVTSAFAGADVHMAHTLDEAIDVLGDRAQGIGAVLLDLRIPGVTGFEGLLRVTKTFPDVPVIVISGLDEGKIIAQARDYGARGFIPKGALKAQIIDAIRTVRKGRTYFPDHGDDYADSSRSPDDGVDFAARIKSLTAQQLRILELVCEGKLNKQIAYELSIAETTVKAHITAILRKLGVHSRTQAVLAVQKVHFSEFLSDGHS